MQKIIIYSKPECHLCEEARHLLLQVAGELALEIEVVDIIQAHNENLREKYFERIPVLALPGREAELAWPFSLEDIRAYLLRMSE